MNIYEFQEEYPNLITRFREENPHKRPFWNTRVTKFFLYWLQQQKNIKVTVKRTEQTKIEPDNHISEFFSNFLKEHTYFSKRLIIGIYKDEVHPYADEYDIIKREFAKLIGRGLRFGVIKKYSLYTFEIIKDMVERYSEN